MGGVHCQVPHVAGRYGDDGDDGGGGDGYAAHVLPRWGFQLTVTCWSSAAVR